MAELLISCQQTVFRDHMDHPVLSYKYLHVTISVATQDKAAQVPPPAPLPLPLHRDHECQVQAEVQRGEGDVRQRPRQGRRQEQHLHRRHVLPPLWGSEGDGREQGGLLQSRRRGKRDGRLAVDSL